jgi:hypothetical protein
MEKYAMQTTAPDNDEIRLATLGAFWYFCSMAAQQKSHRTAHLAFTNANAVALLK